MLKKLSRFSQSFHLRRCYPPFPISAAPDTIYRAELAEPTRAVPPVSLSTAAATAAAAVGGGGNERRSADGDDSGHGSASRNSSCFRSGLIMEGDSAFGPLGQIEENGSGGAAAAVVAERGRRTQREQRVSARARDRGKVAVAVVVAGQTCGGQRRLAVVGCGGAVGAQ